MARAFDVPRRSCAPAPCDRSPHTSTTHNSVVVAQAGGIVVIEAPLTEPRSVAVLAKVRELFPGRSISGVINTHSHFDHAGGLRTYVDAGVPVITHARNAAYYRRAWAAPRTIAPDRLAASIGRDSPHSPRSWCWPTRSIPSRSTRSRAAATTTRS